MNRRTIGDTYEREAAEYLMHRGYRILARNYRIRQGEIDLIARDGAYLVFVEVKYRKNQRNGSAAEAVGRRKQLVISRVARHFLYVNGYTDMPCRFDVVAIDGVQITHIKNAFEAQV